MHIEIGGLAVMKQQFTKIFGLNDKNIDLGMDSDEVKNLSILEIIPSPYQPRTIFDDDRINELCQTIKTHGVIQPIIVRIRNKKFEIIAGERRYRAVKKLGMTTIPAIIREFNDSQAASIALIENLQREGLTAIEEASAYQQLIDLHQLTQESLAQRLGKSQSTIANKIRLLHLSTPIKEALMHRKISERHARALLSLETEELQVKALEDIVSKELNVKQTELRVNYYMQSIKNKKVKRVSYSKDIRLALNTIRQSISMITDSGMEIKSEEKDLDDHYEIVIKIPKRLK